MQALRVIKQPQNHQVVIDLPPGLGSAARVEVIVFAIDDLAVPTATDEKSAPPNPTSSSSQHRQTSPVATLGSHTDHG